MVAGLVEEAWAGSMGVWEGVLKGRTPDGGYETYETTNAGDRKENTPSKRKGRGGEEGAHLGSECHTVSSLAYLL